MTERQSSSSSPPTTLLEARSLACDQEIISQMQSPKGATNDGSSLPSTQEVQEKALEDQEACGSSQEEPFDKPATLTDGSNQTDVRTSVEADSRKTQDSRAPVSPSFVHHDVKREVQELQEPQLPRSIVLALPAFVPLDEDQRRRERRRQLNREAARRFRIRKQQELEELQIRMDNLIRKTSAMVKNLRNLAKDCMELARSNNAIEKEIIEKFGPDAIADLLPFKPARDDDESHSQGSDSSQSSTDFTGQS